MQAAQQLLDGLGSMQEHLEQKLKEQVRSFPPPVPHWRPHTSTM
jgi:hypothetical protein